jgi:hypothetical protein
VKPLPLVAPPGCTLSTEGLVEQLGRADRLAPAVLGVTRSASELQIAFAADVDHGLVREVVATEQTCCSFLELDYAAEDRDLRIGSDDPRGLEVMDTLAAAFGER